MKKVLLMIVTILLGLTLIACTNDSKLNISISGTKDWQLTQNEAKPDFLLGVTARDLDTEKSYTANLIVKENIDTKVISTYELLYEVKVNNKVLSTKKQTVEVVEKQVEKEIFSISGPITVNISINQTKQDILSNYRIVGSQGTTSSEVLQLDDAKVNYNKVGYYQATLSTVIDGKTISKTIKVEVVDPNVVANELSIFYLNDLHGAIFEQTVDSKQQMGLSKIYNHIETERNKKQDDLTLFIAGGDMLQGQMASNYFDGASTIEALNAMGLDAFVIGNHEFDWGLDKVLQYFNGNSEIQGLYPLLGANVYEKATNKRPEGIKPYTIINRQGIKVGIIGVIGDGLESSIAKSRVERYEFKSAYSEVETYTKVLREEEMVDFVIVVNHNDDDYFNRKVAQLDIDMIYNGHSHRNYIKTENNKKIMQSGANGEYLGYAQFSKQLNVWQHAATENLDSYSSAALNQNHPVLDEVLSLYKEEVDEVGGKLIIKTDQNFERDTLTNYMAKLMAIKTNVDIAFHNYGGTRTNITKGEDINLKKLYAIFPFDNVVVTMTLKGSYIKQYMSRYGSNYYMDYSKHSSIRDNDFYTVAVNDYSYGADNVFANATNVELTDIVLRDLIYDAMMQQAKTNTYFSTGVTYVPEKRRYMEA